MVVCVWLPSPPSRDRAGGVSSVCCGGSDVMALFSWRGLFHVGVHMHLSCEQLFLSLAALHLFALPRALARGVALRAGWICMSVTLGCIVCVCVCVWFVWCVCTLVFCAFLQLCLSIRLWWQSVHASASFHSIYSHVQCVFHLCNMCVHASLRLHNTGCCRALNCVFFERFFSRRACSACRPARMHATCNSTYSTLVLSAVLLCVLFL